MELTFELTSRWAGSQMQHKWTKVDLIVIYGLAPFLLVAGILMVVTGDEVGWYCIAMAVVGFGAAALKRFTAGRQARGGKRDIAKFEKLEMWSVRVWTACGAVAGLAISVVAAILGIDSFSILVLSPLLFAFSANQAAAGHNNQVRRYRERHEGN